MTSHSMSLRLDSALKAKLSALAKREERPVNYLIANAVKRMVADHEFVLSRIDAGLDDLEMGRVTPHEDVMREGRAIVERAQTTKKPR